MVGVGCEVTGPVQSAVIVPDWKNILTSSYYRLDFLPVYLFHECYKILGWIAVYSSHFITFFHWKFLHHALYNRVWIVIKFLEIVTEVSHDMCAFEYAFKEVVFVAKVVHVWLLRMAKILVYVSTYKLILESMYGPSDMCGQGTIAPSVRWFSFPDELRLVL